MAKALFPLRSHTAYTQRWKAKGTAVVVIRSDSHGSKINFEQSEKHSTVRSRGHIPEMTALTEELSPESSCLEKKLLSMLQIWGPTAQAPGVISHGCGWLRGFQVGLRQSDKPELKHQEWRSAAKTTRVPSPNWCVNIDISIRWRVYFGYESSLSNWGGRKPIPFIFWLSP